MRYEYLNEMVNCVYYAMKEYGYSRIEVIKKEYEETGAYDWEALRERLNKDLFADDGVTGNGTGSFFSDYYDAEEALCHNSGVIKEVCMEFDLDMNEYIDRPEALDVAIRCYLLPQAIDIVIGELREKVENDE